MRTFKFIITQVVILGLVFVGLGTVGHSGEPVRLSIVSGVIGGNWYPLGGGITKIAQKYVPNVVITLEVGGGVKTARMIGQNPSIIGFVMPEIAYFAIRGEREFKEKIPLRLMLSGNYALQHIVSLEEFGINQIEDLQGKKVGVNAAGSNAEQNCRTTLQFHGITYNNIQPKYLPTSEMVDALRDKVIVAGFVTAPIPLSVVTELAITHKVKLIPIRKEMLTKLVEKNPYFSICQIPAMTYKGQLTPIDTSGSGQWLVAHADLSEDVVYKITKAVWEHTNELAESHPSGRFWTAEQVAQEVEQVAKKVAIPLHRGTEKYLREKGLLK